MKCHIEFWVLVDKHGNIQLLLLGHLVVQSSLLVVVVVSGKRSRVLRGRVQQAEDP